ncbi:MAG: LLM class flavin-dependent oxidoreductase [Thermoleophilaceae bacterium]
MTWPQWTSLAEACERLGFEGLFRSDHYLSTVAPRERGALEAWGVISALAARTERLRLGALVTPPTFRHPYVLAKLVSTADHVSDGRVELAMGAGWFEAEHRAAGFLLPPLSTRYELLEEQLGVLAGLFSGEAFTFAGRHYSAEEWSLLPRPIQRPGPPIILGGKGRPRLARLVALYADEYNCDHGSPATCLQRYARVRDAVQQAGRDPASLRMSLVTGCLVAPTARELKSRALRVMQRLGRRGDPLEFLASVGDRWVLGTPEQAAERLWEFEQAGVERIMLQQLLHEDLEMLELLAERVFPAVRSGVPA